MSDDQFENSITQAAGFDDSSLKQNRLSFGDKVPSLLGMLTGWGITADAILAWGRRRRYARDASRNGRGEHHGEVRCFTVDCISEAERTSFSFTIPAESIDMPAQIESSLSANSTSSLL